MSFASAEGNSSARVSQGHAIGIVDQIELSKLTVADRAVRTDAMYIEELACSIREKGLLQPIVVRPHEDLFEIVAGHRRYQACKLLRWRKITCHIVALDDRSAFETSLIENIQRKSMSPIEEAKACKKYVEEYGWGSIAELASKIGKSSSYVSKRIAMLDLPPDVLDKLNNNWISPSAAEELLRLNESREQSELAAIIATRHISVKGARDIIARDHLDEGGAYGFCVAASIEIYERALEKMIMALKLTLGKISPVLEDTEDNWFIQAMLMHHRSVLHAQIDILLKEKKKLRQCYRHIL